MMVPPLIHHPLPQVKKENGIQLERSRQKAPHLPEQ